MVPGVYQLHPGSHLVILCSIRYINNCNLKTVLAYFLFLMGKKIFVRVYSNDNDTTHMKSFEVSKIKSETMNLEGDLYIDYEGDTYEVVNAKEYYDQLTKRSVFQKILDILNTH